MKFSTTLAATSSLVASAYAAPTSLSNSNIARAMNVTGTTSRNSTFNLASTGETYGAAYCEHTIINSLNQYTEQSFQSSRMIPRATTLWPPTSMQMAPW